MSDYTDPYDDLGQMFGRDARGIRPKPAAVAAATEPKPLSETITYDGRNASAVTDWARQTSDHYERNDTISASGMSGNGVDQFALNINGQLLTPAAGEQVAFSDRTRQFSTVPTVSDGDMWNRVNNEIGPRAGTYDSHTDKVTAHDTGADNPWPRDHPMTPAENTVLYQVSSSHGVPEGVVPEGVVDAKRNSTTGQPGVRHPVQPVREPLRDAARTPQFGEHAVTDLTNRIGKGR